MTWELAGAECVCGYCRASIVQGQPVLLVTEFRRPRCMACAKDGYQTEPPDAIELTSVPETKPLPPMIFKTPGRWAHDFKAAQAGDR